MIQAHGLLLDINTPQPTRDKESLGLSVPEARLQDVGDGIQTLKARAPNHPTIESLDRDKVEAVRSMAR